MHMNSLDSIRANYIEYLTGDIQVRTFDEVTLLDTVFCLPDGTILQVAVEPDPQGDPAYAVVSDYGAVADFFFHHADPLTDDDRMKELVAARVRYYGAHLEEEVVELRTPRQELASSINRVAQAAIAAAAMWEQPELTIRPAKFRERVRDVVQEMHLGLEESFAIAGACEPHQFDFGGCQNGRFVGLSILSATQGGQAKKDRKVICWDITDSRETVDLFPGVLVDDTTPERKQAAEKAGLKALENLPAETYWWTEMVQAEWEPLQSYRVEARLE